VEEDMKDDDGGGGLQVLLWILYASRTGASTASLALRDLPTGHSAPPLHHQHRPARRSEAQHAQVCIVMWAEPAVAWSGGRVKHSRRWLPPHLQPSGFHQTD